MRKLTPKIELILSFCLCLFLLGACSEEPESTATEGPEENAADEPGDVVARVGDQTITFSELNTMMNSSPIVGLSMPALGTPGRDKVRLTLLDKMISANLLYLDAMKQGVDKDPGYQRDLRDFSNGILAGLYQQKKVSDNIEVTEADIQEFYKNRVVPGTELTEEARAGIEATIRKNRFMTDSATMRTSLREGIDVTVDEQELNPADDEVRVETTPIASIDGQTITWGEVKAGLGTPRNAGSMENRLKALNEIIDFRLMAKRAKEAGLEQDPVYQVRFREYSKTRLINVHRTRLYQEMDPTREEIRAFYEANRERIMRPESRSVQMLVLKTESEAEGLKQKIEAGEITLSNAAIQYSTAPDAATTSGKIGWVTKGSGFSELDEVTFALAPGEIGGPVESPAGWHLVKVLDMKDAFQADIEEGGTQQATRRLIFDEKLDQYVINLRENEFPVEIYDDTLNKLAQQEVDWFAEVSKTQELSPEEIKARIEKLRK